MGSGLLGNDGVASAYYPLLCGTPALPDVELTHLNHLAAPLQAQRHHLLRRITRAKLGSEFQLQRGGASDDLLAVTVEIGLDLVFAGLGLFERERLRTVSSGVILRHAPALIGDAVAVIGLLAIGINHPQIDVGVIGVP